MNSQFFTIGILTLFSAMLPGPDFAIVTKNTLLHSRRSGIFTALGVGSAIAVHMTYCALGLAIIIYNSTILFNIIKYVGSAYLIYIGVTSLFTQLPQHFINMNPKTERVSSLSHLVAFREGFLCNLLNPKAMLFFLALFTMVVKSDTPSYQMLAYAIEVVFIAIAWFCILTVTLSHPRVTRLLERVEKYIAKLLGIFLIIFGIALALMSR